ncbi:MAG: ATP-binding protein [Schwartzia sp.]|nr:ATP-binding protein [Schwartzia sp. (in: firmicutes)]
MKSFVDREREMATLAQEYEREAAALVILYGRRRVGKTALIREFIKDKPALYFLVTEESAAVNRASFQALGADFLSDDLLRNATMARWEDIFAWILRHRPSRERFVLVIDEFQYLGKANAAFPSVFQKIWDTMLQHENIMVILCGSLVSLMVSQTLAYDSPLYGRRTAQMKLAPVNFGCYGDFFPEGTSPRALVELYSVTGGVPRYIREFQARGALPALIRERVLNPNAFLFDEPRFLLQREVEDIGSYFALLRAIAAGNHRLSDIASALGQKQTSLPRYLNVLVALDILEREVPVTEMHPEKSKRGLYFIKDNFLSFWFKFVWPNISYIESGHPEVAAQKIRDNFIDNQVAFVYEKCCREAMWQLGAGGELPFPISRVGRWWDNKGTEIDVVALSPEVNGLIAGECKFWKGPVGLNVLNDLQEKVKAIDWNRETRKVYYVLFSIGGFTPELQEAAKTRHDVILAE